MTHAAAPPADPPATPLPGSTPVDETARLTARITLMSLACAAVLTALKTPTWLASGSIAALASLADSALDFLASLATFTAVRYAVAPPDREHRYGHGKAEAFASLIQAGLVFASAALVGQDAIQHLLHPEPLKSEGWAMGALAVSTLLTALLVTAQGRVLKKANSVAVSGDRAHYMADLASNFVAFAGIGVAALTHLPWVDAAAGLVVTAWLVWGAVNVFREAAVQLMDHELPDDARASIVALVSEDHRILDVHGLRTRAAGPYVHIQMHVAVPAHLSLEDAHQILVAAERRVLKVFPAADILIHADPFGRSEPHGGDFTDAAIQEREDEKASS